MNTDKFYQFKWGLRPVMDEVASHTKNDYESHLGKTFLSMPAILWWGGGMYALTYLTEWNTPLAEWAEDRASIWEIRYQDVILGLYGLDAPFSGLQRRLPDDICTQEFADYARSLSLPYAARLIEAGMRARAAPSALHPV
ncbi:MAG: hypothetical protein P4M15_09070 [Alphaproteobacteria bacterium]|nr:hypothetical protein [Alphaproteobacteria bacterium]